MNGRDDDSSARPMQIDTNAISADAEKPAFLAPPPDAPAYYGFPILDSTEIDGFRLGVITDLGYPDGDGFVEAPDGSRAGIVWFANAAEFAFEEIGAPEPGRWGIYAIDVPHPMRDESDARELLQAALPHLRRRWREAAGNVP